jgi:multidrug resistance efflux pump
MESTEKKPLGKNVVLGILLLGMVGAGLTWIKYTGQSPSTENAWFVSDRTVIAIFSARAARNIREGTKAIVTLGGRPEKGWPGTVNALKTQDAQTEAVIILKEAPQNAPPQTRCDVTVDTSVNSEQLRSD